MATLYRSYRPQNWEEVVNQNHIKITLSQEIATGKIAHAYLFTGPRGVGKTTVARVLAKSINCEKRPDNTFEPCNKCNSCQEITSLKSLDILEIDAASHTGVDNVRENIIAASRIAPSRSKYKIFIIDEVHMLSLSAFNALLKILEEPPENVVFILSTTEVHKIPATIISRCQRFDFKRISVSDITKKLKYIVDKEQIKVDKKILEAVARQSEGHMRDAESLLGQIVAIGGKEITPEEADLVIPRSDMNEAINLIEHLSQKDAAQAIGLINKMIDEGIDIKRFLLDVIELLRKFMLIKINPGLGDQLGLELGENIELRINEVSQKLQLGQIINIMEKFLVAKNSLRGSFIIQLPLEIAIAEICVIRTNPVNPAPVNPSVKPVRNKTGARSIASTTITPDNIQAKWHEVLAKVKKYDHSLSFILRVCEPRDLSSNQLCLAFKYKFHKERMNDLNIRQMVERVLNEVYGQPLTIEAIIDENIAAPAENNSNRAPALAGKVSKEKIVANPSEEDMLKNIIDTFGGKEVK